jgi:hypothetical protein
MKKNHQEHFVEWVCQQIQDISKADKQKDKQIHRQTIDTVTPVFAHSFRKASSVKKEIDKITTIYDSILFLTYH